MTKDEELQLYKSDPGLLYNNRFFRRHARARGLNMAAAKALYDKFHPSSVLDVGCGIGGYLEGFLACGVKEIHGVEYMLDHAKPYISPLVLPFVVKEDASVFCRWPMVDLVMSIEVAEHILPERSEVFAANLAAASKKWIVMTAATPTQRGTGHFNGRHQEYWIDLMDLNSFDYRGRLTRRMGRVLKAVGRYGWLKDNLMIFEKEDVG